MSSALLILLVVAACDRGEPPKPSPEATLVAELNNPSSRQYLERQARKHAGGVMIGTRAIVLANFVATRRNTSGLARVVVEHAMKGLWSFTCQRHLIYSEFPVPEAVRTLDLRVLDRLGVDPAMLDCHYAWPRDHRQPVLRYTGEEWSPASPWTQR